MVLNFGSRLSTGTEINQQSFNKSKVKINTLTRTLTDKLTAEYNNMLKLKPSVKILSVKWYGTDIFLASLIDYFLEIDFSC